MLSYTRKIFLEDKRGGHAQFTLHNTLRVSDTHRLAGGVFNNGTLDTNVYEATTSNGGTVTVVEYVRKIGSDIAWVSGLNLENAAL